MPCEIIRGNRVHTNPYVLDKAPIEFSIEEFGWQCKLGYEGDEKDGKYLFWINGILVTTLPKAPPIKKENIPIVCQSDNLVFLGEVTKRTTFQIFIDGQMEQFVADHNARSQCT